MFLPLDVSPEMIQILIYVHFAILFSRLHPEAFLEKYFQGHLFLKSYSNTNLGNLKGTLRYPSVVVGPF